MGITVKEFGLSSTEKQIFLYEIANKNGMRVTVTNFGAVLQGLLIPDRNGKIRDVVWGFDNLTDYEKNNKSCFGATIGRIANRVRNSSIEINHVIYQMEDGGRKHCLHSGPNGYHLRVWDACVYDNAVRFTLLSPDGDQGLPGNFIINVTYELSENNGLMIIYDGLCDKDTYVSMTNHSYFNLNGETSKSILEHELWLNADYYTQVNEAMLPTGKIKKVSGSALDFREWKTLGQDISSSEKTMKIAAGYDHNFVLNTHEMNEPVAKLLSAKTGICMEVFTDCPCIQIYSGNFLNDIRGKYGQIYNNRSAIALETQQFPDAMHHNNFPNGMIEVGMRYHTQTEYRFSVIDI